ncbi:unnamed protein product [Brachionus calyciflorus]|uniref:FLYWCH-type domain-containing protein n=1 Tax=Brachionus calyciflorus TaxID=104777 RepID=A0A813QG98_9BILA|nr:unnamed protein product [Brachionus calyciflorus]
MIDELSLEMDKLIVDDKGVVTLSQKNFPQLYYFGQYFRLIDNTKGSCKWRCVKPACNVKCLTNGCVVGEKYSVKRDKDDYDPISHPNHSSDPVKFTAFFILISQYGEEFRKLA